MGPYNPSEKIDAWHPNIPLEYLEKDPDIKDSSNGYKNFSHIELAVQTIDILELHYDGHIRFTVDKNDKMNFLSP